MELLFSNDPKFIPYFKPLGKPALAVLEIPQFRLLQGHTLIGRDPASDLVLNHHSISRVHARVEVNTQTGLVIIRDLQSTNGILVNGKKVPQCFLKDQNIVQIGDCKFCFCLQQTSFNPFELMEDHSPPTIPPGQDPSNIHWGSLVPEAVEQHNELEQDYAGAPWNNNFEENRPRLIPNGVRNKKVIFQAGTLFLLLIAVGLLFMRRSKESSEAEIPKYSQALKKIEAEDQRKFYSANLESTQSISLNVDQQVYKSYLSLIKNRDQYQKEMFTNNEQVNNTLNLLSQNLPKSSALYTFFETTKVEDIFNQQNNVSYEEIKTKAESALDNGEYSAALNHWQFLVCEQPGTILYSQKISETFKAAKFSSRKGATGELFKQMNENIQKLLNRQQVACAYRLAQIAATDSSQEVSEQLHLSENQWLQAKRMLEDQIKPLLEEANIYVFHKEYLPAYLLFKSAAEIYPEDSNIQNGLKTLRPYILNMEQKIIRQLEQPDKEFSFLQAKTKMIALLKSSANPLIDYPLIYNYLRKNETEDK